MRSGEKTLPLLIPRILVSLAVILLFCGLTWLRADMILFWALAPRLLTPAAIILLLGALAGNTRYLRSVMIGGQVYLVLFCLTLLLVPYLDLLMIGVVFGYAAVGCLVALIHFGVTSWEQTPTRKLKPVTRVLLAASAGVILAVQYLR